MGCVQSRKSLNENELEEWQQFKLQIKIKNAIAIIYEAQSPVIISPMIKSQRSHVPTPMNPWSKLDGPVKDIDLVLGKNKNINLFLKMENFQQSGSFKLRGAYNIIKGLYQKIKEQKVCSELRIVIASTGNHAAACAFVTNMLNNCDQNQQQSLQSSAENSNQQEKNKVSLTIFVPNNCAEVKISKLEGFKVIKEGYDCVQTENKARQFAIENFSHYISPYNDADVVAASGTIGYELANQFQSYFLIISFEIQQRNLDYVFVSVGGGGLISGIAYYLKLMKKLNTKIIGVQPLGNACMNDSLQVGHILNNKNFIPSFSDATDGGIEEGSISFQICQNLVDDWILVSNEEIKQALVEIIHIEKVIVEGSAALAYAGCLKYLSQKQLNSSNDQDQEINCSIIFCGQNISQDEIDKVINGKL